MLKAIVKNTIKLILSGKLAYSDSVKQSKVCDDEFTALYPLVSRRHLEVGLLIEGQAAIQLPNHIFSLSPDSPLVILPNTMHCEGCFNRELSYKILWVVFISRGAHFFISEHHCNKKRMSTERLFVDYPPNNDFWVTCCNPNLSNDYLLQAKLSVILLTTCMQAIKLLKKTEFSWPVQQKKLLTQVENYIKDHCSEKITLKELASFSGYTANYLGTLFLGYTGQTIHQYILNMRLKLATEMLLSNNYQIKEIAFLTGFKDPLYFSRLFRNKFGQSPSEFKNTKLNKNQ